MNGRMVLRALAIVIAIAAVIDPAIARNRHVAFDVAVIDANPGAASREHDATATTMPATATGTSMATATHLRTALRRAYTVVDAPLPTASATIVTGNPEAIARRVRALGDVAGGALVAVTAVAPTPSVRVAAMRYPRTISIDESARIDVDAQVDANAGDSIVLTVRDRGLLVGREARAVAGAGRIALAAWFTPSDTSLAMPIVDVAVVRGSREVARGASIPLAIDVGGARHSVLFYDARPSWMSVFVRRALESDPRVTVTSRSATARGISTDIGRPPPSLTDLASLTAYDVVVLGAPDALSARDVAAMDRYLRRGGSVVLLADTRASNSPVIRQLAPVRDWIGAEERAPIAAVEHATHASMRTAMQVQQTAPPAQSRSATNASPGTRRDTARDTTSDSRDARAVLRVTEWLAPAALPAAATPMVWLDERDTARPRRALVWRVDVGAGTLLVSGALDSWRFRDSSQSRFSSFWRNAIAAAAAMKTAPLEVRVEPRVTAPGAEVGVTGELRDRTDPRMAADPVTLSAQLEGAGMARATPIPLWPGDAAGRIGGRFIAPTVPGHYRVVIAGAAGTSGTGLDSVRASTEFVVSGSATGNHGVFHSGDQDAIAGAWIASHGGVIVPETARTLDRRIGELLDANVTAPRRVAVWYPMRSAWWILPFALLLGAEWYDRRRRGLV